MLAKKQVYEMDANGYLVKIHVVEFDAVGNPVKELPSNYITLDPIDGLYRAKWTGTAWIEDMAQSEIDVLNIQPPDPDAELATAITNATTLEELKKALLGNNGNIARVKGKMK